MRLYFYPDDPAASPLQTKNLLRGSWQRRLVGRGLSQAPAWCMEYTVERPSVPPPRPMLLQMLWEAVEVQTTLKFAHPDIYVRPENVLLAVR